jgi:hypothetical protein
MYLEKRTQGLEQGLKERGFIGVNEIDGCGNCHKDERHYILRTDGLVIYTTYPWAHDSPPSVKDFKQYWDMEDFSFEELDEVMMIVEA